MMPKSQSLTFAGFAASNTMVFVATVVYLLWRFPTPAFFLTSLDHGYQLAMGVAVADGRLPGIDYFTLYGPFVGLTSGLGLAATHSLAGEIIICAVGYALAICCASSVVRRQTNPAFGWICVVVLLLLLPRYYKWYYWFFPLSQLAFFQTWQTGGENKARSIGLLICWGLVAGFGFLFRWDLGLVATCFVGGMFVLGRWAAGDRPTKALLEAVRNGLFFLLGFSAVPLLWAGFGILVSGWKFVPLFIDTTFSATTSIVEAYSLSPFAFDLTRPFSAGNCLAVLQVLLPLTYVAAILIGLRRARQARSSNHPDLMFTALGLIGLGLLPQGLYRADVAHLLQVIAPTVILLLLAAHRAMTGYRAPGVLALPVAVALAGIVPEVHADLGPPIRDWFGDWQRLTGLPDTMAGDPVADIAIALRDATRHGEPVFMATTWTYSPILVLSGRYLTGIQPVYAPGVMTTPDWLERNRLALSAAPPRFLVVAAGEWEQEPAEKLAPYIPDTVKAWRREFTLIRYENSKFRLLERQQ